MQRVKGFTLMELMVVIAIIMILAGAVVARLSSGGEKAKDARAMADMETIASACRAFYGDTGCWPASISGLLTEPRQFYRDNEGGIIEPDDNMSGWKGPYLSAFTVPKDPWDKDYTFSVGADNTLYVTSSGKSTLKILIHRFSSI